MISKPTILVSSGCGCIMMSVIMSIYHLQTLYIARKLEMLMKILCLVKEYLIWIRMEFKKYIKVEKIQNGLELLNG